jgi:hypothetical protein
MLEQTYDDRVINTDPLIAAHYLTPRGAEIFCLEERQYTLQLAQSDVLGKMETH